MMEPTVGALAKVRKIELFLLRIPQSIVPELQEQLRKTTELYEADLKENFTGVFLPDQLEKKIQECTKGVYLAVVFSCANTDPD